MSTCYIVGAGEFYGSFKKREGDLVIAADGGYDTLMKIGVTPDLLIGDMDSINAEGSDVDSLKFPVRKDETDTFLAYREGVRRGYTNFELYGCVGGREDHTFANYSLLIYARDAAHSVKMFGNGYYCFAMKNEKVEVSGQELMHLSVFAFGGEARGVCLRGLEYSGEDITLSPLFPLGVSNRFTSAPAEIEVRDGRLLVMVECG